MPAFTMTYIGGPTALIGLDGVRFLTDPTFDPAGTAYPTDIYTLKKWEGPAINTDQIGQVDAVLLSHDHHYDNLDHAGRQILVSAAQVLTTVDGADRLGGHAVGLAAWQSVEIAGPAGRTVRVTGTPARHGPSGGDRGPVTEFVLAFTDAPNDGLYISGDTVWYEGIEEIARRFNITAAVFFMGAATVKAAGPSHLTMTAEEGVRAARLFDKAIIIPLHYSGWEHFSESRNDIQSAFSSAGLQRRLRWLEPGVATSVDWKPLLDDQSTRDTVERLFAKIASAEPPELIASEFSEEIDWDIAGDVHHVPWIGKRKGRAGVADFFHELRRWIEPVRFQVLSIVVDGEQAVALGELVSQVKSTGGTIESAFAIEFIVRHGLIVRYRLFEDSFAVSRAVVGSNFEESSPS